MNSFRIKETKERYAREEAAASEAKMKPLLDEQNQLLRKLHKEYRDIVKKFWGRPLAKIFETSGGATRD